MAIRFFNTMTRYKQEFEPIQAGKAGIYSCGPTVYGPPHIGNFASFMFVDLLKRYLKYRGFEVTHVMNITDVDDKTIRDSRAEGLSLTDFTRKYEAVFFDGLKKLNCIPADHYPRATEYIPDMIALTQRLLDNNLAYESAGSVYYRVCDFKDYGELAHLDEKGLRCGASGRVDADEYDRESIRDFALWKGWTESDGDIGWDSPFGRGRPGWHIECSAMSMKLLGETFDIHTGGIDLVFPHHQNEIAQSEGATGKKYVNYWLHRAFVNFEGEKMAKSLGNVYTVDGLSRFPGGVRAYRYLVTTNHHRTSINFSNESMDAAWAGLQGLQELIARLKDYQADGDDHETALIEQTREKVIEYMDDDLNSPRAIAEVHGFAREINRRLDAGMLSQRGARDALDFMDEVNAIFGIFFEPEERVLSEEQKTLIDERNAARAARDWKEADRIRDLLLEQGIQLKDTPEGVRVTFID